jgi:hypothetical protein
VDWRLRFSDLIFFPSLPTSHSLSRYPQILTASARSFFVTINSHLRPHYSLQLWHPGSRLMQPLRLAFSFDHLTSALFCLGPSTSLNAPSLAGPRCRRFSAPDHTQTLLPLSLLPFQNPPALLPLLPLQNPPALLPLLPFQNPPALPRARNLLDLRMRTGSALMVGLPWPPLARLLLRSGPFYVLIKTC